MQAERHSYSVKSQLMRCVKHATGYLLFVARFVLELPQKKGAKAATIFL
jgi:hypothetical protein